MANIYVRSTDGNNADNGSTWALAKLDLAGAAAIDAAGDTVFVSDAHAESTAASITIALAGTPASPVKIICGDDVAEPPTALTTTGTVTTTGASNITISGSCYVYGIAFKCGTGTNSAYVMLGSVNGNFQTYENCAFELVNTGAATARIKIGDSATGVAGDVVWKNCSAKLANVSQAIVLPRGMFTWNGGSWTSGGTSPSALIEASAASGCLQCAMISGVDLSNLGSSVNLVLVNTTGAARVTFRDCKLPASWSGSLTSGTHHHANWIELFNCDSGDTNYRLWVETLFGSIKQETTIVRTGGASDGATALSWKMASSASAVYPNGLLVSPEIVVWNDTTGSSKTVTVEVVTDNVTLTDAECWLEVMYLGTSGVPLGSWRNDAPGSSNGTADGFDVLAAAANQTTSSETWTTTGLATPVKQKLSVTFTPQEKGFIHARVVLAKASTTVYVDPKLTVA